nr:uncharacterized protein LOC107406577 isoform X1 [Ziziphus jujuba var. spinosa]XP_048327961.1 uncharacterized protein LOC107406577 isoform X1 [Ziziphus jujuba var. spinosa]
MSDCSEQILHTDCNDDVAQEEGKVDTSVLALPQNPTMPEVLEDVRVENPDGPLCSIGDGANSFSGADVPGFKSDQLDDDDDYLDHIILKERQRMILLSRKYLGLKKPVLEIMQHARLCLWNLGSSVALLENLTQEHANKGKEENNNVNGEFSLAKGDDSIYLSERKDMELNSCEGQHNWPMYTNDTNGSSLSTIFKIKDEPSDDSNINNLDRDARSNFSISKFPVKIEQEISNEINGDEVDHMYLGDRIKLLRSRDDFELNMPKDHECLKKYVPSVTDYSRIGSESAKPTSFGRPQKRKKTATDSIETALEEDAPGLLQVLVDKGVSVDEMKLYGEMESDEAIDESSSEDSFTDLQAVISKLFVQRNSFLKFAPLHYAKGARANYCLACLLSLVEQTRYLQFRKWPVEWGWCRDLQSFIFVFERHNRLVLERPEYGYATYFFELVDSLPLDWQIKRLVTAMKLTSCSRISLIENRPLLIGEDLTKGEAKVLMEYGWVPNSGLGTMLKYCNRVVHDRKNEKEISEWRSKIGKLLMDGYNGGTVVLTDIPMKVMENRDAQDTQIKLEL